MMKQVEGTYVRRCDTVSECFVKGVKLNRGYL